MSNWKDRPLDLIGKRIEIEWANTRRYRGTVIRYNQYQFKHTIQYDDGDVKDYDMYTRRFWIIGGSEEGFYPSPRPLLSESGSAGTSTTVYGGTSNLNPSTANSAGTYAYPSGYAPYQWTPYVSRTIDANTLVSFHVVVDPKLTGVQSVRITGNVEVLGAFGDGVPMVVDSENASVWSVSLHLPFTNTDYHIHGIFQFHYELVMTDGSIVPEGQGERTEQKLKGHFYHAFRPDYRLAMFRYATAMAPKVWFQQVIVAHKQQIKRGTLTLADAVNMYGDLFDSCVGAQRVHVEECFEDEIDVVEDTKIPMIPELYLYFLFAIGKFGLTSSEKVYNAYNYNYTLYGTANEPNVVTFRTPPKPTQWVFFCADTLDVPTVFGMDWNNLMGIKQYLAVMGVVEAIERLSEHGYYSWLRIFPLVSKSGARPRINRKASAKGKKGASIHDEFMEIASIICRLIEDQFALHLAGIAAAKHVVETAADVAVPPNGNEWAVVLANDSAIVTSNNNTNATADDDRIDFIGLGNLVDEHRDRFGPLKLAKKWIRALIIYAPMLTQVVNLVEKSLLIYNEHLTGPLLSRLEDETFLDDHDVDLVLQLLGFIPALKSPKMAAAMFNNLALNKKLTQLLNIVTACIGTTAFGDASGKDAAGGATVEATDGTTAETVDALTGDWLTLNTACKEWIQRTHGAEPAPVLEAGDTPASNYSYGGWLTVGYGGTSAAHSKPKKKEQSEAELAAIRHAALKSCLNDVDCILRLPVFTRFPQGIIFELSRCWFLNGSISLVLEAIFTESIGGDQPFGQFCSLIANFLENKVVKIIRDSVTFKQNMMTIATVSNKILLKSSPLFHSVMLHLIVFTNNPDLVARDMTLAELVEESNAAPKPNLRSILDNYGLWKVFIDSVIDHAYASAMFGVVIEGARSVLATVAEEIVDDSVSVGSLNTISPAIDPFMLLLSAFRCMPTKMSRNLIEIRLDSLIKFERQMEEVQTFASFYCSCGVRMNATSVRQIVDNIRARYQSLQSRQLFFAFAEVTALPHVGWLYERRSSELFLQLWGAVGKEICIEQIAALQASQDPNAAAGDAGRGIARLIAMFNQGNVNQAGLPVLGVGPDAGNGDPVLDEEAAAAQDAELPEDIRAERAAMRFAQRQQANIMIEQVEDVVLDQNAIVQSLIPRVRRQWEELSAEVFSGRITIQKLDSVFNKRSFGVTSAAVETKLAEELRLMLLSIPQAPLTRDKSESARRKAQLDQAFDRIKDFMLLRQLCKWLPSIISLHELVIALCSAPLESDPFRVLLQQSLSEIQGGWSHQTLESIPSLVISIKGIFGALSSDQLDFVSLLASAPNLLQWLLARSSTEEFNRLLQVVRPCTDEPRLLSAIASLVHVRTLLLQPLYTSPPYSTLEQFLRAFQLLDMGSSSSGQQNESAVWHLNNVISSFDALMDIFEKQTRSPGIKSCFDLRDIRERGTFILRSCADASKVLSVEITRAVSSPDTQTAVSEGISDHAPSITTESLEYLLDLRSKLLMTEIPPELEDEMQASRMVDAFVQQLQVLSEMSDMLSALNISGHVDYQSDFSLRIRFTLDGLVSLQEQYNRLRLEAQSWSNEVKENRSKFYFLNYFTMREILKMRTLALKHASSIKDAQESDMAVAVSAEGDPTVAAKSDAEQTAELAARNLAESIALAEQLEAESELANSHDILVMEMEQMGFSRETAIVSLHQSGYDKESAIDFCFSLGQQLDRIVAAELPAIMAEIEASKGKGGGFTALFQTDPSKLRESQSQYLANQQHFVSLEPLVEIENFLHQVSTQINTNSAETLLQRWKIRLDASEPILTSLGMVLEEMFAVVEDSQNAVNQSRDVVSSSLPTVPSTSEAIRPPPPPGTPPFTTTIAAVASKIASMSSSFAQSEDIPAFSTDSLSLAAGLHAVRALTKPGAHVPNRADLLYVLDSDTEKRLPVFITCTEDPNLVIDTVLSIFVRRGRLPEPGEVLFCTTETTSEELNIFLLRFVLAKKQDFDDYVFCIADLHNLSYTQQCALVEILRTLIHEHGQDFAATLAIISGMPRQMALNALSSQYIELPPLPVKQLKLACKEAFEKHCGATLCVASTINGGGKSHYIKTIIGQSQKNDAMMYVKVPIRESTSPRKLIELLLSTPSSGGQRVAYHIDVGHIIPAAANTMLFQLLLVGVLQDSMSCRVFHRRSIDNVFIEMPNSLNNKTALALRVCTLLPTMVLSVSASTLMLTRPVFVDVECTQLDSIEYGELTTVCKWLRAIKKKKLKRGTPEYTPDFSPEIDAPITTSACFELLSEACCAAHGPSSIPSWSIFHTFIMFMNMQFSMLSSYDLMNNGILDQIDGLENFRSVFVHLLVETSKDFSLRSVAQVANVGPPPDSEDATGLNFLAIDEALRRANSANTSALAVETGVRATSDSASEEPSPAPPRRLTRQTSSEVRQAAQQAEVEAPHRMVRQTSEEMVARFQTMISWEQSDHPIVSFKVSPYGGVSGVDILSLNPEFLNRYINGSLKANLEHSGFNFARDWDKITNAEGVEILRQVEGLSDGFRGGSNALEHGYVMTIDNVLKMLSIQLRLRFNVPVIIMGETGCGKSTLIRNMCIILGVPLHTLNVHGGIEDADIIAWMEEKTRIVSQIKDTETYLVVFLDEINTCNCMGLFKEIVCDRTMNGRPIHDRIKIIAACNPYRLRKAASLYGGEEMAGLAFETFNSTTHLEGVGTGIKDPLRNLVYRVHPLPESMIDFVYDFGSLSEQTESLYIKAMLRRQLGIYNQDEPVPAPVAPVAEAGIGGRGLYGAQPGATVAPLKPFDEFVEVFSELVCSAQECIRRLSGGERSSASLRDVSRCVKVFIWFGNHFANNYGSVEGWDISDFFRIVPKVQKYIRKAVVLSLAYCYHARLPRAERKEMVSAITSAWREMQVLPPVNGAGLGVYGYGGYYGGVMNPAMLEAQANWQRTFQENLRRRKARCTWLNLDGNAFHGILEEVQKDFVSKFALGEGIALNEAILENLFMILISVLNEIPIFVIGKPGSSKSLAMGLIQANLNGDASDNDFLRSLPAVEVFSYQCSPLSTSAGIEQAFESSRRYRREAQNTVVVVLLDEVGLAEQSPHLPLKVLHKMFDEAGAGEGVVGISNWALDPAKMNRAVHLYRPAPSVDDLSLTAEGMVKSANLKGYLRALARAYNTTYQSQEHPDFWGLREFYSTVRAINSALARQREEGSTETATLDSEMLLWAILRNYGGRPTELVAVLQHFFTELGLGIPQNWRNIPVERLIIQNLTESDARHLMLLTHNNAALSLLFDRGIVSQDNVEIIFGSDFPLDQNDLQVCLNIQRVKLCMAEGRSVILVHCESLYESLYDLLNQHYVEYGGQTYVRLAFGSYTRLCPIHKSFRVVVIVEVSDAYTRLAPPLLNRFEKQVFERKDTLRAYQLPLLNRLKQFANAFALTPRTRGLTGGLGETGSESAVNLRKSFCGYHSDMMSSLILSTEASLKAAAAAAASRQAMAEAESQVAESASDPAVSTSKSRKYDSIPDDEELANQLDTQSEETLFQECVSRLLWIATPEATCRLIATPERERQINRDFGVDCSRIYFKEQRHSSLSLFAGQFEHWSDELGVQGVVMTYSPLSQDAVKSFNGLSAPSTGTGSRSATLDVTHIVLHELDQERSLRQAVQEFFKTATAGSTLLVQCDPLATSKRRIEHTKFILESARSKYLKSLRDQASSGNPQTSPESAVDAAPVEAVVTTEGSGESNGETLNISQARSHGVHVILLLHLPRGDAEGEHRYCVDFDTRWKFAFVDAIVSADAIGLPDVEGMIGKNIMEVLSTIDMRKALIKSFRTSLAKLKYSTERTNEDVRHQIVTILTCLESKPFVASIANIFQIMQAEFQSRGGTKKDYQLGTEAAEDHMLLLTGTFQGALHMQILNTISDSFAAILSHIDRNNSLCLLLRENMDTLWEYLFKISFNPKTVVLNTNNSKLASRGPKAGIANLRSRSTKDTLVKSDGFGNTSFPSKFPFSFYLCPLLDSMRNSTQHAAESQLRGQFSTMGLEFGLDGDIDDALIRDYVHDLVCMKCRVVPELSRESQTEMLIQILEMVGFGVSKPDLTTAANEVAIDASSATIPDAQEAVSAADSENQTIERSTPLNTQHVNPRLSCLASVHHRFWKIERILDLYFELMGTFSASHVDVLKFCSSRRNLIEQSLAPQILVDGAMHKQLLDIFIETLEPWAGSSWDGSQSSGSVSQTFGGNGNDTYDAWLHQVESAQAHINSLVDLIDVSTLRAEVKTRWSRIEFFRSFLQNIAIPLELSPAAVRSHLQQYTDPNLCSQAALCSTVRMLCSLNEELVLGISGNHMDFICHITLQRMVDPVMTADNFNFERSAITAWFAAGNVTSPVTNLVLPNTVLRPNTELKERLASMAECDLSHFLEYFVFEVIVPGLTTVAISNEHIPVLLDLVSLAAGSLPASIHDGMNPKSRDRHNLLDILPSPAARTGIIRELLLLADKNADSALSIEIFGQVTRVLADLVTTDARNKGHVDVPLAISYMMVEEDKFASILKSQMAPQPIDFTKIKIVLDPRSPEFNSLTTLSTIASIRSHLTTFADLICALNSDQSLDESVKQKAFYFNREVANFFESFKSSASALVAAEADHLVAKDGILRGLKLFLLKQIERKKGISFLRNSLLEPPLALAPWLIEWKQSIDVSFSRFLGSNKIPKVNPLTGFPLFGSLQELVAQFLLTGNSSALDAGLQQLMETNSKRLVQGALLLASFHEIFLLALLPLESTQGLSQRRAEYDAWLMHSPVLRILFTNDEHRVFLLFASSTINSPASFDGSSSGVSSIAPVDTVSNATSFFSLSCDSSADAILRLRVAAHAVAAAFAAPDEHPLALFRTFMIQPGASKESFYPTMEEDVLKMAQEAMGGRWYRCPNQHPYYVDMCGRPTIILNCRECGAQIGGLSHNLLQDNEDIGNVGTAYHQRTIVDDNTERNYCLRDAQQESQDKFYSVRNLEPRGTRAIRVLMHLCMLAGAKALGSEWAVQMDPVFNRSYCNPGELADEFIFQHVNADWNLLCTMMTRSSDDIALLFHLILLQFDPSQPADLTPPTEDSSSQPARVAAAARSGTGLSNFSRLSTTADRKTWESWFSKGFVRFTNEETLANLLATAEKSYSPRDDDDGGSFVLELLEKFDLASISPSTRRATIPGLLQFTRKFDFSHFQFTLGMVRGGAEKFPLLTSFLQQEPIFRSLRYLSKAFEWFSLIRTKFSGHIDRDTAREKTVGDIINELDEIQRPHWVEVFMEFSKAWNNSWSFVQKFGCLAFSADFVNSRMDFDTKFSFCLPNDKDEGLCPMALIEYLVTKHNELVQRVDEALLLRAKRSRQEATRAKAISSRFLTSAHCFNYDLAEFISFLEKQCVLSGGSGYDFTKAEARLIERYLSALPAVDLELAGFIFAHEQQGTMVGLRQKLRQEPLSQDVVAAIKREFTGPAQSFRMLDTIEIAIDFLSATGGSMIDTLDSSLREMLLVDYVKTVLLVDDSIDSHVITLQIRLKHLEGLWSLLMELTSADPFEKIEFKYKQPLTEQMERDLSTAISCPEFDVDMILGCMKSFALEQLVGNSSLSELGEAYEALAWRDVDNEFLSDIGWFADHFPRSLLMANFMEGYKYLQTMNNR